MKKMNLPGTRGADMPRVPFVYFVCDAGLLQLVGGVLVCWNELAVGTGESVEGTVCNARKQVMIGHLDASIYI